MSLTLMLRCDVTWRCIMTLNVYRDLSALQIWRDLELILKLVSIMKCNAIILHLFHFLKNQFPWEHFWHRGTWDRIFEYHYSVWIFVVYCICEYSNIRFSSSYNPLRFLLDHIDIKLRSSDLEAWWSPGLLNLSFYGTVSTLRWDLTFRCAVALLTVGWWHMRLGHDWWLTLVVWMVVDLQVDIKVWFVVDLEVWLVVDLWVWLVVDLHVDLEIWLVVDFQVDLEVCLVVDLNNDLQVWQVVDLGVDLSVNN